MNAQSMNSTASESRYNAVLSVSNSLAEQSDVRAILHSVSLLLSKIVGFDRVALLLLNENGHGARMYALESEPGNSNVAIGQYVSYAGTSLVQALENQTPVYIARLREDLASSPELLQYVCTRQATSAYVFPISTARGRIGILVIANATGGEFSSEEIELMTSVSVHIGRVLETALALSVAKSYERKLARERDRLKLVLEINNHTIAHLDMSALFRAASKSIHAFFDNAFTGFWLFDGKSSQLELMSLDFPRGAGFIENTTTTFLREGSVARLRARVAAIFDADQIRQLPESIAKVLRENSIVSLACVPLAGSKGPLGVISLGSREKDAFTVEDLDILSQIANQISLALDNAIAYRRVTFSCRRLEDERNYLASELQNEYNVEDIVGKSAALKHVLEQVAIVAPTDSTVLLIGESGTGKELVARAVHNLSLRRARTFVRLNCAAVPSGLIESELFGHEKGAFTGALMPKRGRIELAHEGSLFLDEIGDISLELQPKLLRVLQEREFERLGSNRTIKVDTRLIAATHRDLHGMARKGEFREDLFYRLNVFPIHIPPLRDRRDDIPLLVHYFVATLSRKMRKSIRIIPPDVMDAIRSFDWPGNVRELQNFIERSVILSGDEVLAAPVSELNRELVPKGISGKTLQGMEREMILNALREAEGKVSGSGSAANRLGLKRTTLQRKMQRLRITKADYA